MKAFCALLGTLDQTGGGDRVAELAAYLGTAPQDDRLWCLALLSGKRPKRVIPISQLRLWATEAAALPLWLFDETCLLTGDLAETAALILPAPANPAAHGLLHWITVLKTLSHSDPVSRKSGILSAWTQLPGAERRVFNKLLTGGFRSTIKVRVLAQALSQSTGLPADLLTLRLMWNWSPDNTSYAALIDTTGDAAAQPLPFAPARPLAIAECPGPAADWAATRHADGMRAQLILRSNTHFLWAQNGDLLTDRFPELRQLADDLPTGTVIDGDILAFADGQPLPFAALQARLRTTSPSRILLAEAPVILMAHDLLEHGGRDIRAETFQTRRALLDSLPPSPTLKIPPLIRVSNWQDLGHILAAGGPRMAQGLLLKHLTSPYGTGPDQSHWRFWGRAALTIDAVLIYAQQAAGQAEFSFAVWQADTLVPLTKASVGLSEAEQGQISAWVGKNTLQRFGPVRQVSPVLVFEIAFDDLQPSSRHKSGLVLRHPRISRWRQDKTAAQANTLDDLQAMLALYG